jgi:hypothetical protein
MDEQRKYALFFAKLGNLGKETRGNLRKDGTFPVISDSREEKHETTYRQSPYFHISPYFGARLVPKPITAVHLTKEVFNCRCFKETKCLPRIQAAQSLN